MIHWHIRTISDLNNISPVLKFVFPDIPFSVSFEYAHFKSFALDYLRSIHHSPLFVFDNTQFSSISAKYYFFEWGPGLSDPILLNIKNLAYKSKYPYFYRSKLLSLIPSHSKTICLPHGYNIKLGLSNRKLSFYERLKGPSNAFSFASRNVFDIYIADNYSHLARNHYFGLSPYKSRVLPFIGFIEKH